MSTLIGSHKTQAGFELLILRLTAPVLGSKVCNTYHPFTWGLLSLDYPELMAILLPQPLEYWDYKQAPPGLLSLPAACGS